MDDFTDIVQQFSILAYGDAYAVVYRVVDIVFADEAEEFERILIFLVIGYDALLDQFQLTVEGRDTEFAFIIGLPECHSEDKQPQGVVISGMKSCY